MSAGAMGWVLGGQAAAAYWRTEFAKAEAARLAAEAKAETPLGRQERMALEGKVYAAEERVAMMQAALRRLNTQDEERKARKREQEAARRAKARETVMRAGDVGREP